AQRTPGVDQRGGDARVHQLVAEPGGLRQLPALGPGGEHRLGALVHRDAGHLGDPQLAADPVGALEHGDPHPVAAVPPEVPGRGEARDAPADDRDVPSPVPLRGVPGLALATRSSCHTTDVTVPSPRYGPPPSPRRRASFPGPSRRAAPTARITADVRYRD